MKYYKLKMEGKSCVYDNLDELTNDIWIALDESAKELSVTVVEMTEEEYEALGEFQGW